MSNVLFVHFPLVVLYRGQFTLELTLEVRIQRVDKTHIKKHTFGVLIHLASTALNPHFIMIL